MTRQELYKKLQKCNDLPDEAIVYQKYFDTTKDSARERDVIIKQVKRKRNYATGVIIDEDTGEIIDFISPFDSVNYYRRKTI
ncbi:MAG: hypothetical protein FWD33_03420 [Alphaproteobacteria bacterium]|nr:hypothetical protein [Alphaproteobacteria bacterium]